MKNLPNGCGVCGIEQRGHAIQVGADGSHTWMPPTQEQIKERMLARRATEAPDEPEADAQATCRAAEYGDRTLCGCMNCVEYTADRDSEDGC